MKARFLTIPDSVLCIVSPEEPEKAYVLGRCIKNIETFRSTDWIPSTDSRFRPATQQDFKDYRVYDGSYRTDSRYDFPMHPYLEFFKQMNPQAEVECNNSRIYWQDDQNSHRISFFTNSEKEFQDEFESVKESNARTLWLNCDDGWLRFVTQPL